jgi:hypothetical protein
MKALFFFQSFLVLEVYEEKAAFLHIESFYRESGYTEGYPLSKNKVGF